MAQTSLFPPQPSLSLHSPIHPQVTHHRLSFSSPHAFVLSDMSAGHFSASDRYKHMKEQAFEYAFVLDVLGCTALVPHPAGMAAAGGGAPSVAPVSPQSSL